MFVSCVNRDEWDNDWIDICVIYDLDLIVLKYDEEWGFVSFVWSISCYCCFGNQIWCHDKNATFLILY